MITILAMVLATASGEVTQPPPIPRPAAAPAHQATADAPLAPPDQKHWYGWELLISDAAFVTLASRSHWRGSGLIGAGLGITIGTPLLHAINGNGDSWLWSTTGRSLVWVAAYAAAMATTAGGSSQSCDSCTNDAPAFLAGAVLLVGGGILLLVDDLYLAQKAAPPDPGRRVALVPSLAPTAGGATMGLCGVF